MSTLRVRLAPVTQGRVAPIDVAVDATIVNEGTALELFHQFQAQHAPLVLQVEHPTGRRLVMPPPPPPTERDLGPPSPLGPGESVTIRYAGFIDAYRDAGPYRVRWFSPHEALGGSRDAPLASEWIALDIFQPGLAPPGPPGPARFADIVNRVWEVVRNWVRGGWEYIFLWLCRGVVEREVVRKLKETISGAPPGAEAWNQTYEWWARFNLRLDQPKQHIYVTIRIQFGGIILSQAKPWVDLIESKWSYRFKDCATLGCAANGYSIILRIQPVTVAQEAHYGVVRASTVTDSMTSWGLSDTDQAHEVGHMLGNKDEYFTVDGINFGQQRQPKGNIMNNPANDPVPTHCWLIQETVDAILGITYSLAGGSTRRIDVPCNWLHP